MRTRRQAADFFGVTETTIWRWETGKSGPPSWAGLVLKLQDRLREQEETQAKVRRASAAGLDEFVRAAFRVVREQHHLTQDDVATRANVSRSWVAHFERHNEVPSVFLFSAALRALGLNTGDILAGVPVIGNVLSELEAEDARTLLALLLDSGLIGISAQRPKGWQMALLRDDI